MEKGKKSLEDRLEAHPVLKKRIESLLDTVEDVSGDVKKADEAERQVIETLQKMGQEALETWAGSQEKTVGDDAEEKFGKPHEKKIYWQTTYGKIEVMERIFRIVGTKLRPFANSAGIKCRGYSLPLQRIIVDFGADTSFNDAKKKINEHYAIDIPEYSIQFITETHAKNIIGMDFTENKVYQSAVDCLISETDGTMIPIVEVKIDENIDKSKKIDRRKHRTVFWKEARLCFSRKKDSVTRVFTAVFGSVDETGDALFTSACRIGFGKQTQVHGVGDGASWIVDQFDRVFAKQATYLIDFFHLTEYLLEASKNMGVTDAIAWRRKQQNRMKKNHYKQVLKDLNKKIKSDQLKDPENPVVACHRYIKNRTDCLDYAGAIENDLPIGSGEIESSHRYVIQKRLKISGAWWREDNARAMLALRVLRANDDWEYYWQQQELKAA